MSDQKKEYKYRDIAIAYEGESEYGKYIKITWLEDYSAKKDDQIYLNENKYKGDNEKAPHYKISVKNETESKENPEEKELPF